MTIFKAYTLLNWNQRMNFCPSCASPLRRNVSGTLRACTKPCDPRKANNYPPIFPVAITRVTDHSDEKVLLVRQPQYPRGMFTCISGFMEAGERYINQFFIFTDKYRFYFQCRRNT